MFSAPNRHSWPRFYGLFEQEPCHSIIFQEGNPKNGGLGPEQPGALLVTLLAQVVVLYVGPDSLGHFGGGNLLALAAAQYGS